jgi:hypothetical protein
MLAPDAQEECGADAGLETGDQREQRCPEKPVQTACERDADGQSGETMTGCVHLCQPLRAGATISWLERARVDG